MRLRNRLSTVLLQWVVLLTAITVTVWLVSMPGLRRRLVDERLLLARTVAHALDTSLSAALQGLGRLATDLPPDDADLANRLHAFRFQSPFNAAAYVLDADGQLVAADPQSVQPLSASWLGYHEAVTPLVRKPGHESNPVLAAVQPFRRNGRDLFLVAEMNPSDSMLSTFLRDLEASPTMQLLLVDEHGVVVAASDETQLFHALPGADAFGDRIAAHRPLILTEELDLGAAPGAGEEVLAVMAPLRFAAWGVVIHQSQDSAFASLGATSRGLLFTGAALALLGFFLARTLSRSVVTPIRTLSRQAQGMRKGDLTSVISVTGDYEIEVLARTLDDARVRLSGAMDTLRGFNEQLEAQVAARTRVIEEQHEHRRQLVRRLLSATEDERRRLARELHDEIAQMLTVIQLSLHHIAPETPELAKANQLLVKTQEEIHRIIHDLRPSLLDDLGLASAMKSYAEDHLQASGLRVRLEIEDGMTAPPEVETVVFRIFQELLTNIVRHARAEHVSVELYHREGVLVLDVEDDGQGFDPSVRAEGAGMTGMRERAAVVSGQLTFDSEPGLGTHALLEIPLS